MSFSFADSLPHPPFRIWQLILKLYRPMKNIGFTSKIFVWTTVWPFYPRLLVLLSLLCSSMYIAEHILLYLLSCPQFHIFIQEFFFDSPTVSRSVTRCLEGAKGLFGSPSVSRKIITKEILCSMISLSFNSSLSFTVFRTIWRVAIEFYGLLRYSEVCQLLVSNIRWTDLGFDIFIKKLKTDKTCKGDWSPLPGNLHLFSVL